MRKRSANVAAATGFCLCESETSAGNVLSVRKRSDSNKAPNRNGNQPLIINPYLSKKSNNSSLYCNLPIVKKFKPLHNID
ncbi:hypothetical protein [Lysinibacillus xylanilyticus]|uniref:hypothetical protein n=1 Tax=Lysinibacillus xylanilyticus TaxID=582475 RepID=UPI003CFCE947